MSDVGGPAETPKWQLINENIDRAKKAQWAIYAECPISVADDIHNIIRHLLLDLDEAQKVVDLYWDGIDLLNDGPDDEDKAHAQHLLQQADHLGAGISEAYRIRQKEPKSTKPLIDPATGLSPDPMKFYEPPDVSP